MSDRAALYDIGYSKGYRGFGVDYALRMAVQALGRELTPEEREEVERGHDDGVEDGFDVGVDDDE